MGEEAAAAAAEVAAVGEADVAVVEANGSDRLTADASDRFGLTWQPALAAGILANPGLAALCDGPALSQTLGKRPSVPLPR